MDNTFTKALALLNGRTTKKLDNNTYARVEITDLDKAQRSVFVKLHSTDIVTIAEDGTIILDSGTWRTPTTKDRINTILYRLESPYTLHQEKGAWYLSIGNDAANMYAFADGMTIQGDTVRGAGNIQDSKRT